MPEYLYPGVYVEEVDTGATPISGVSTTIDTTMESLAADFRRTLQAYVPEWKGHDESDPGVTLLEIFAFLSESLLFRADPTPQGRAAALRRPRLRRFMVSQGPDTSVKRPLFFTGQCHAATLAADRTITEKRRLTTVRCSIRDRPARSPVESADIPTPLASS
jgi:phage tail sheath protein FI